MTSPVFVAVAWALLVPVPAQHTHPAEGRVSALEVEGHLLDPETRTGVPGAQVFFEGATQWAETDADGRFVLPMAAERALIIEHRDYLGLRVPPGQLHAGADILALPHRRDHDRRSQRTPLVLVHAPGSSLTATVSPSDGEWCGADSPQSDEARETIEAIRIVNGSRTQSEFGATAVSGVILVTCKGVAGLH